MNGIACYWRNAAESLSSSHWDEVSKMITEYSDTNTVNLQGAALTVGQVAAVARRQQVKVHLNDAVSRTRVTDSVNWIAAQVARGTDVYSVNTGFGNSSDRRTTKTSDLQKELIRFLNAGVIGKDYLPLSYTKCAMLVQANSLAQGYSGIRWEIVETLVTLINLDLIPVLPLRGSITASGDLVPLSYIAGVITGRHNAKVMTAKGETISAIEALNRVGVRVPFELHAKEGVALVNGTAVGASVAAIVCFDANLIAVLAVVLSALFCEVMRGKKGYTDDLIHRLKHHPGQIEAAAMMRSLLEESDFVREEEKRLGKARERYALRTSPQWLGPQIEVIRAATHAIEREINSVNDNPIIDVERGIALHGGNFQGTPVGVSMDNLRIALAAIGKLVFAQFSELVCDSYSNGLPSNLMGGPDPSLDYGFKGAEVAMAAYCSELQYLANPVTTHVHSAEQNNQDVNSLGLISARKSAESIDVLNLMIATYLVALCQAVDLRHLEESMKEVVKQVLHDTVNSDFSGDEILEAFHKVVDDVPIFSYIDDPCSPSYPLLPRLQEVLVNLAFVKDTDPAELKRIPLFMEKLKRILDQEVKSARNGYEDKEFWMPNRIMKCKTYPIYEFVRSEVGTEMLSGSRKTSPGEEIEKVLEALTEGKLGQLLIKCLEC